MKLKKLGIGSTSLLLLIFGFFFMLTFKNGFSLGDTILNYIGLKAWSNGTEGTHYTIFYSLFFFITSLIIGYKYKENFASSTAKVGSFAISLLIIFSLLFAI